MKIIPIHPFALPLAVALAVASTGCGDDGTEADRVGVAAECVDATDCLFEEQLQCLDFKGGYCGLAGCTDNLDCPEGSACVAHTDGTNYCFRLCADKIDCNRNRTPVNEANCSANVVFTAPDTIDTRFGFKACVPPSG